MLASKCSRNHFISEKYKTVKFKLHFLQNSPLCKYTLLPAFETFLEAILLKPFQLFRRILTYVSRITKSSSFNADFHRGNR
jgi:hypothetical protein